MRYLKLLVAIVTISVIAISCKPKGKTMVMEDFVKIDLEIASSDQKPEKKKAIAEKYGYTIDQYNEFAKKIEKDPKLLEKRGELMLKKQKSGNK